MKLWPACFWNKLNNMEYRQLGGSGFKVPVLTLGTGTFGGKGDLFSAWGNSGVPEATRLVDISLEAGLTMFDSADVYSDGIRCHRTLACNPSSMPILARRLPMNIFTPSWMRLMKSRKKQARPFHRSRSTGCSSGLLFPDRKS